LGTLFERCFPLSGNTAKTARFKISAFPGIPQFCNPFKVKNSSFKVPYFSPFFELLFQENFLNEKRREKQ
jgi:hypothetical protein